MTKKAMILLAAVAVMLVCVSPAFSQDDVMTLGGEADGYAEMVRPAVSFPHTAHMDLAVVDGACLPCHHDGFEDGVFVEGSDESAKCTDCHGTGMELTRKFHDLCQDCHKAEGAGPLACGDCHVR